MAAPRVLYACQQCGAQSPRWLGRCPDCDAWNSYVEERVAAPAGKAGGRARPGRRPGWSEAAAGAARPVSLQDVAPLAEERIVTGIGEFDRVLGGGFVAGGVVLLGGEPGIGKSTLLLQVSQALAKRADTAAVQDGDARAAVLYVAGEESPQQIRIRAQRLGTLAAGIWVHAETDAAAVAEAWQAARPALVVVDSIQTMTDPELESSPGSVGQVRAAAGRLIAMAKTTGVPLVLVGHITKDGALAGPKVLEHAVDTLLYFEGERHAAYRLVRAAKNRFGAANEIGCFEMRDSGLAEVANPSAWFLAERTHSSGAVVTSALEGTRPLLVEVQALVSPAHFGAGRRTASGFDHNRLALLLAVLERRCGLPFGDQDAFLKASGGARLDEPAADLAAAVALASSLGDIPVAPDTVVFGEVGLGGEVRGVRQADERVREAARLGFRRVVLPAANRVGQPVSRGMEVTHVRTLREALDALATSAADAGRRT